MRFLNAVYAGLCAASGSLFGKLTGNSLEEFRIIKNHALFENNLWIIKIISFILMIGFNVFNMRFYVKALHSTTTTLTATVISSAANYFFSFVFGVLIFNENLSILNLIGIVLIIIGLMYLCNNDENENTEKEKIKEQ